MFEPLSLGLSKRVRKLQQKREREATGLFVAEGPGAVEAAVKNGEAVAVFADKDYLVPMAAESGGALVLLPEEVALGKGVGLAFRDSDDDLRGKFDAAIKSMKCDGTLDAMIVKEEYFGAAAVIWGDAGKEGC